MKTVVTALLALSLGGCALLADAFVREAETRSCREAGPHDAAGPGERVCTGVDGEERVYPASRTQ